MGKRLLALPAIGPALALAAFSLRPQGASLLDLCLGLLLAAVICGGVPWPRAGCIRPPALKLRRATWAQRIELKPAILAATQAPRARPCASIEHPLKSLRFV